MKIISYIFFLIVVVVGISFAYLNAHPVLFNYYFATKNIPLSLLLTLAVGVGFIFGVFAVFVPWLKQKRRNRKLKKRLKCVEQEIENLRNIPLQQENVC